MSTLHAPVPGYDLTCPGEEDAVAALARVLGPERARTVWDESCRAVGIRRGPRALDTGQVEEVARQMAAGSGVPKMIGNSILIRLRTYTLLAARAGRAPEVHG